MSGIKTLRRVRVLQIAALLLNIGVLTFGIITGSLIVIVPIAWILALTVAILVQTRTIRRREKLDRPRPDYSAIAAMERDIYGEAFGHDGAPGRFPVEPQAAIARARGHAERKRPVRYAKPVKAAEAARCYCNWCRGRPGVHGAEATALYRAEVSAVMARSDAEQEHRSNLRWKRPS